MKLHLGCGTKKLDGWVNIDSVRACQPDLVHDISRPLPYDDQTVDELLAEDLLEHFDKYMRYVVFSDWARVLRLGGEITLQVPNFPKILRRYFKFGYDNFVDFIFGENLWRSEIYIGHFGNHKWGYSKKTLQEFVRLFGIDPVRIEESGLNLRLVGVKKRHVPLGELDDLLIYSHANKCGEGRESVPLRYAREKMAVFQKQIDKKELPESHESRKQSSHL